MEVSVAIEGSRAERLATLYAQHAPKAGRLAFLLLGDKNAAEDLVQEAFIRVAGRLTMLRRPEAFEGYLRQTVVNLARSHVRRKIRDRSISERVGQERIDHAMIPDLTQSDSIARGLRSLPYRQRAAIVLRFYLDLSETETAEVLGCAVGTVKSSVHRGLQALRTDMEGRNDE